MSTVDSVGSPVASRSPKASSRRSRTPKSAAGSENYEDDDFEATDAADVLRSSRRSGPMKAAPKPDAPALLTDEDGERIAVRRSRRGNAALGRTVADPPGPRTAADRDTMLAPPPAVGSLHPRVSNIDLTAFVRTMAAKERMQKKKQPVWRTERIERLAVALDKNPKRKFANPSDAKHCRFVPKIGQKSREMAKSSGSATFEVRMESKEQSRRTQLERARGEADYNARLDRKACPDCGSYQTYDEWKKKIKTCQNEKCPGREFRPKLAWGDVQTDFINRLEGSQKKKDEQLKRLETDLRPAFKMTKKVVFDPEKGTTKVVEYTPKKWDEVASGFLKRNEDDQRKREENHRRIMEGGLSNDPAHAECTFKPKLNSRRPLKDEGTFEERMLRDIEKRKENLARMESAARKKPKRPASAKKGGRRAAAKRRGSAA